MVIFSIALLLYAQYAFRINQAIDTKFSLFRLRDKLRRAAIGKEIDARDRLFKAIDTSISKTIKHLARLNLWEILILYSLYRRREDLKFIQSEFFEELHLPKNDYYKRVYEEYAEITLEHLKNQHYVLRLALLGIVQSVKVLEPCISFISRVIRDYLTYKQSSTLYRYYSAH